MKSHDTLPEPQSAPIEDYAIIGDGLTVALVCKNGSIDWLCWPRLDSPACFAALLGAPQHGRWLIAPREEAEVSREYEDGGLVLVTTFKCESGTVRVRDLMPMDKRASAVLRIVEGVEGRVPMRCEIVLRPDYGRTVPWVERMPDRGGRYAWQAVAGPDRFVIESPVEFHGEDMRTVGEFDVAEGETKAFRISHGSSHGEPPEPDSFDRSLKVTRRYWSGFSSRKKTFCEAEPKWQEAVERSLVTLKALAYFETGGIAAAATTSLPEDLGGVRNWDYRYCWLRDAAFVLTAFMQSGYTREACAYRDWLVRAIAGTAEQTQIMYGLAGERTLTEWEIDWLPGYENSRPVRIGNAAAEQFQIDVYGETIDALQRADELGIPHHERGEVMRREIMRFLERNWRERDDGIWEIRGPRQHYVHSKVMAWVAFDRAANHARERGEDEQATHWREIADTIHAEVCDKGFDQKRGSFKQHYGSNDLDASLLLIPIYGFLPADDERMVGTVKAVEEDLVHEGFVHRYQTEGGADGLKGGEGTFIICSYWLARVYAKQGRVDEAREIFERLLRIRNDVGLMAEEYDPKTGRQLGNFPQAFSHVGLINTAAEILRAEGKLDD